MTVFRSTNLTNASELPAPKTDYRVHIDDTFAPEKFSRLLSGTITEALAEYKQRDIVIMCIGTDRSTGDCLGPLVGSKLSENPLNRFPVFGTLDDPVHASNLVDKLALLNQQFSNPLVLAVDACLGRTDSIGYVSVCKGALQPGAGVKKTLPEVGQLTITGIVNIGGFMEYFVLQNTRLSIVMKMANIISKGLILAAHNLQIKKF